MIIAKVVGSAVATLKHDSLKATKLLLVSQADAKGNVTGEPFLAVDLVGAGEGAVLKLDVLVLLAFIAGIGDHVAGWISEHLPGAAERVPVLLRSTAYAGMVVFLYHAMPRGQNPFIYFQF